MEYYCTERIWKIPVLCLFSILWFGSPWSSSSTLAEGATVSVTWGGVESSYFNDDISMSCNYAGEIRMSHPMSIDFEDKHYVLGSLMLKAGQMTVDKINMWPRCGVSLADGQNYSIALQTYGDESDKNKTARIGEKIVNNTDFMLAGYSSSLTSFLTPIAQGNKRICVTGGSSRTSVHADRDYVFGLNAPSKAYLENAFKGTAAKGAKTVAYLAEETASACSGSEEMSLKYGMYLLNGTTIPEEAPLETYETVARSMKVINPDLMITCVRTRIDYWNKAMRNVNWTPKAQVYTYVVSTNEFEQVLGPKDLPYVMGVSSWDSAIPPIPDVATGWTPKEFDEVYEVAAFRRPAYQQVQQSAVVSVLVQAIERVGYFHGQNATDQIKDVLATQYFPTVYGNVSFDENGQNAVPFLLLQYDEATTLHVLLPEDNQFTDFELKYPLPTWGMRDCLFGSKCRLTGGTCTTDEGVCQCVAPLVSKGKGPNATCEEPNEIIVTQGSTNITVAVTVSLLIGALVAAALFTYYFRKLKRHNDSLWKVQKTELVFGNPPEIVGRGSFGMVLLAEYRSTLVAVKRVLPPANQEEMVTDASRSFRKRKKKLRIHTNFDAKEEESETIDTIAKDSKLQRCSRTGEISIMSSGLKASQSKMKEEFIKEMRTLSKLRHPCIISVMGAVVSPNVEPMLILEYMHHGSLYDILHNDTVFVESDMLLTILHDTVQGCRFLHAAQVIHGDLKAQNVLVDSKFRAKISDYGLSQKELGGTPENYFWKAPELLTQNAMNTEASDVYAYGIVLYEAFSRKDPYHEEDDDVMQILHQVADPAINKRPPVPPDCPAQLASLMCDCLVANPEERPSFEELDKRLQRIDITTIDTSTNLRAKRRNDVTSVSLFDIFPQKVAKALRDGEAVEPEHRDMVTIFFSDIVGFTNISERMDPRKVADMLDRLYHKLDALSNKHDIFKVETIGDSYMAVTNLVKDQPNHASAIAKFSVDVIKAANETMIDEDDPSQGHVDLRVGFHSGPVVADVVGSRNPRYCLFGDTVNTASRMESNSEKNRIHCSQASAELLQRERCDLPIAPRGNIHVKGKGEMFTFWINEEVDDDDSKKIGWPLRMMVEAPLGLPSHVEESSIFDYSGHLSNASGHLSNPMSGHLSDGLGQSLSSSSESVSGFEC